MISSRVIHNVSRCSGRQIIARRVFSKTARAGDVKDEDHGSEFQLSRVASTRRAIVRLVVAPQYNPTIDGDTVLGNFINDMKSDLQGPRAKPRKKSSTRDSNQSTTKPKDDKPINESKDNHALRCPRQFSITTPDPKRTTKEQVLHLISTRARMSQSQYVKDFSISSAEEAIVILATPAFAKWLENDDDFIKHVLERLTHFHKDKKPNYVVVIGAVVDGLAPSPDSIPIAERAGPLEGFSFLHGLRSQVLSPRNVWETASFKNNTTNPEKLSHLIFSGKSHQQVGELSSATTISLPLANTLFVNGKHSTLQIDQWTRRYKGAYKSLKSEQKQFQHVKAFRYESTMIPPIFVPAVPLTLPRPIASGLGNIIRQLSFGSEDVDNRPASSELETQVTRYMKFIEQQTTVGVWALIYRKELLNPNLKDTTLEMTEHLESTWGNDDENLRFVGTQLALGAILCRVVSGGGGWGSKQGLLSLDPQLTHEDIASARFDHSPHSIEEGQDSTLGNLARRGDHIQFFTINPNKLKDYESPMDDLTSTEISGVDSSVSDDRLAVKKYITQEPAMTGLSFREASVLSWSKRATFGVVPSTIDKLPKSDINDGSSNAHDLEPPFLTFRKGEFGAVSESGIFLHSSHQKRVNDLAYEHINTKIDMPYSYLYRDQAGTLPQETQEYLTKSALRSKTDSERLRKVEERRKKTLSKDNSTQEDTSLITKKRVGHTRWPKYSPESEKKSPIRKVNVGTLEKEKRFSYPVEKQGMRFMSSKEEEG
ncbi:hypothetical protein SBOR_3776 [Sclerotinia borealis F-4128]|uniref:Uncharacterized protein n=1 Tax=Sclerotinia borealis (strain F-4128) TaxID=1432307 RepID=W9CMH9_SCLBF|nr:hypothetical protein SBOR_3776 [Sclerotinia borealis F-4128]